MHLIHTYVYYTLPGLECGLMNTVVHTRGTQLEHSGDYSHGDNLHKLQYRRYCLARGGADEGVKPHTFAFKIDMPGGLTGSWVYTSLSRRRGWRASVLKIMNALF
jgi:hypothetical protein